MSAPDYVLRSGPRPSVCAGSLDVATRTVMLGGKRFGVCAECGRPVGLISGGRLRTHRSVSALVRKDRSG